ncbi:ArsR/SmtB family transcription factor [Flavobacterium cellulosilyticum]|uniref:ArsR family transcriptional regulator n=1 Tax=Flavobacterium cellulosilyticum TaxID=2541731 RepID=A0A4V6PFC3_9FLAO|nr:metalloregulator ArsR/SmtB family transcription factor [Flavobacterium cellulosilyticum]TDD99307.1 ArsR family transcriptional regulator [Flavobacterium cellulosilyticum]
MIACLNIKQVEKISKALGDPYRLKIMNIISKSESCVQCCDVSAEFNLAQSTMSHHLKQLIDADLLIADKDGRNLKFVINKEVCAAYADYINSLLL